MLSSGEMISTSPRTRMSTRFAEVDGFLRRFSSFTATWTAAPGGKTSSVPMPGGVGAADGAALGLASADALGIGDSTVGAGDNGPAVDGPGVGAEPEQAATSMSSGAPISRRIRAPGTQ